MDEYVSREELIEEIEEEIEAENSFKDGEKLITKGLKIALKDIKKLKAADVQPVEHGKWKHVAGMNSKCSVCSHYFPVIEFDSRPFDINFCPNCGARMGENNVSQDRCSNYMDCDGNCFIDDTPCDCGGDANKCKGR